MNFLTIDTDMTVYETGPMLYDPSEIVMELLKRNWTLTILVHQGETELVAFIFGTVLENVHDGHELA